MSESDCRETDRGSAAPSAARQGLSYRDAGVDRAAAGRAKSRIHELVRSTFGECVIHNPDGFGGLFRVPSGYERPVLVASADGVGTKLKVAILADRHETVGCDLVNHCVNDILVEGARPLFFMDYVGMGRLDEGVVESLVAGMARGCRANGCALLGGETAEMPDFYAPGDYDLAGFVVGVVDERNRSEVRRVRAGDRILALGSDGFHTNGYSLLRRVLFDRLGLGVDDPFPGMDASVADVLLRVHRSYLPALEPLLDDGLIHALAHITGGGLADNLARVLPPDVDAVIETASWIVPPEFRAVMEGGGIAAEEMFRTFNMGIGMVVVVAADVADALIERLTAAGELAWPAGGIRPGTGQVEIR